MVYKSVSIENVIARVIRNTKLSDMSAVMDLYEWIPEGMALLETQYQLEPLWVDKNIRFHQAKLPCGLVIIDAVEYEGTRLAYSNTARYVGAPQRTIEYSSEGKIFNTLIDREENPATGNTFLSSTLEQVKSLPENGRNFYYTKPDYICTSMKEASIRIFYKTPPLDEAGFPLIPDNGNYKEALYWYVRGKLIGSGQLNDSRNTEYECMLQFEKYGARAINEITYPSVDRMERIRANQASFNIPENYWSNFNNV